LGALISDAIPLGHLPRSATYRGVAAKVRPTKVRGSQVTLQGTQGACGGVNVGRGTTAGQTHRANLRLLAIAAGPMYPNMQT
jgi:hypothetical protein